LRLRIVAVPVLLAGVLAGCTDGGDPAHPSPAVVTAELVMQVTDVHETTGMTLLEGPSFAPDGSLYVVDVTAPPGVGKVLRVDLDDESVDSVWTDDSSALTSAQFGPDDGRLYVTDFSGGAIRSMTADGTDVREVVSGPVDGVPMQPDDVDFGADGALTSPTPLGHRTRTGRRPAASSASIRTRRTRPCSRVNCPRRTASPSRPTTESCG
jgi:lactonase